MENLIKIYFDGDEWLRLDLTPSQKQVLQRYTFTKLCQDPIGNKFYEYCLNDDGKNLVLARLYALGYDLSISNSIAIKHTKMNALSSNPFSYIDMLSAFMEIFGDIDMDGNCVRVQDAEKKILCFDGSDNVVTQWLANYLLRNLDSIRYQPFKQEFLLWR